MPLENAKKVKPTSTIATSIWPYTVHLKSKGNSPHTIEAFIRDVLCFKKHAGDLVVSEISLQQVKNFIAFQRSVESDNTINRRVVALRNYFNWLYSEEIYQVDFASLLTDSRPTAPLPLILSEEECKRYAIEASKNPRDYIVVLLFLFTGLKRSEFLIMKPDDIDLSNIYRPEAVISPQDPHKRRTFVLPPEFPHAYKHYIEEEMPEGLLFPHNERFLNRLLSAIGEKAGIRKTRVIKKKVIEVSVSCEMLRNTCAVNMIKAGEESKVVLKKMGLAPGEANHETLKRWMKLAGRL